MCSIGIKELKAQVNTGETVVIEKHGWPVGMYRPLGHGQGNKDHGSQLADNIQQLMCTIAAQRGLTPDALADEIERWATEDPQPT
jgi:hypothetical protein